MAFTRYFCEFLNPAISQPAPTFLESFIGSSFLSFGLHLLAFSERSFTSLMKYSVS